MRIPALFLATALLASSHPAYPCCAVSRLPVVNADQTVLILWDAEQQMEHFVRKASFKTQAEDLGFIVPSPSEPELAESGNAVFDQLASLTAPITRSRPGIGCSAGSSLKSAAYTDSVQIYQRKTVAGYDAVVLKASSSQALVDWLEENDYAYSQAIADWADPYIGGDWFFTAMKLSPDTTPEPSSPETAENDIEASALRISFKTDTPLFPYREPASAAASAELNVSSRLLRLFFIAETGYKGTIHGAAKDFGKVMWTGDITAAKTKLLNTLDLPTETGPDQWWLTEFDHDWPYAAAPGDLLFTATGKQKKIRRMARTAPPPGDAVPIALALFGLGLWMRRRRTNPAT